MCAFFGMSFSKSLNSIVLPIMVYQTVKCSNIGVAGLVTLLEIFGDESAPWNAQNVQINTVQYLTPIVH